MRPCLLFTLLFVASVCTSHAWADVRDEARQQAKLFESAVLQWAVNEGTPSEADAYSLMTEERKRLIELGPAALEEIVLLLEHDQDNVRRGSAIALLAVVNEHKLVSQILLDKVLLRMVEDSDLKTRNNLYHISRKLIANLRETDRNASSAKVETAAPIN